MLLSKVVVWTLVAAILAPPVIYTAFLALASAKRIRDEGIPVPAGMRLTCLLLYVLGAPADVLYNWTHGSRYFKEWPKEWTFSARVQRHANGPIGWRRDKARRWGALLNTVDPFHIDYE
jgi:hypothetical protein